MENYIVEKTDTKYNVYRKEGEDIILEKIYDDLIEIETYITLKNGIIEEFVELEKN